MKLPELASTVQQALLEEAKLIRVALQSIAKSLENVTAIPKPSVPLKPAGPEAIGTYAEGLTELEGEHANEIRERLRAQGLNDSRIENALVEMLTGSDDEGPM